MSDYTYIPVAVSQNDEPPKVTNKNKLIQKLKSPLYIFSALLIFGLFLFFYGDDGTKLKELHEFAAQYIPTYNKNTTHDSLNASAKDSLHPIDSASAIESETSNPDNGSTDEIHQDDEPLSSNENNTSIKIPILPSMTIKDIWDSDPITMDFDFHENSYENHPHFCPNLNSFSKKKEDNDSKTAIVKFSINCENYFSRYNIGVGEGLESIYAIRLATLTQGDAGIYLQCDNKIDELKTNSIIPWVMGYFPPLNDYPELDLHLSKHDKTCGGFESLPLGDMASYMQFELRRMAVAIAGVPDEAHPSHDFAQTYLWSGAHSPDIYQIPNPKRDDAPLAPNMDLDDVAIQFTCGYVLGGNANTPIAFAKFSAYKKNILPDTKSIGIITTNHKSNKCAIFIDDLVEYLKDAFPSARVTIRNDPKETLPMVYTRLIMAKQTFGGLTSFSGLPVVASFGEGYIFNPDTKRESKNKWVKSVSREYENVMVITDTEQVETFEMKSWMKQSGDGEPKVRYWLTRDSVRLKDPYPPEEMVISDDVAVLNTDLGYNSYWLGSIEMCNNLDLMEKLGKEQDPPVRPMLNFTINCHKYFKESPLGTGNWLSAIYGMRLAAFTHGGVDIQMTCDDAWEEKTKLILPWIMGYWPSRESLGDGKDGKFQFPWPHPDAEKRPLESPFSRKSLWGLL